MVRILIIAAIISVKVSISQEKIPDFFNEFSISVNRTNVSNTNTENMFGFGVGANRLLLVSKRMTVLFGVEYNLTRQFKKRTLEGHYAHASNLEYTLNNFSVPLNFRLKTRENNFFWDNGVFVDLIFRSSRKGKMHSYAPDELGNINYQVADFKEDAQLSQLNYGVCSGFGLIVPIGKYEMVIKPEYKWGFHELDAIRTSIMNSYFRLNIGIEI